MKELDGRGGPAKIANPAPMLERYELKYTIPAEQVEEIAAFAKTYCHADRFSASSPDGYYQVNSLYLDSPDFFFLRQRLNGSENRFNMRVRSYGLRPEPPYFLEVKQKSGDIVRKYRARMRETDLEHALDPAADPAGMVMDAREAGSAVLFRSLAHTYNAAPVAMTSYRRRALFSHCDEYARVTFDAGLKYMPQREYRPLDVSDLLVPSDTETLFDEGTSVILELKCYAKQVPLWMVDMIRRFQLRRRGFSKYSAALAQVFRRHAFDDSMMVSPFAEFKN
ncbi:MAG: polyphosphate polymerase domain-containing protein [Fibrobacteria bacterium]